MDYCFMGTRSEKAQPILVVRDRDTRMTLSFLVKEKGATDTYVIKRLAAFLKEVGHIGNRIIIRSDQESAVNAVAEKLAASRDDAQNHNGALPSEIFRE